MVITGFGILLQVDTPLTQGFPDLGVLENFLETSVQDTGTSMIPVLPIKSEFLEMNVQRAVF